jgi:hypothetical protein
MSQELEELTIYHLYRLRLHHGFLIGIKVGCTNNLWERLAVLFNFTTADKLDKTR